MPPSVGLATSLGQLINPGQAALGLTALGLSALAADKQAPHERPQVDGSVITAVTRPISCRNHRDVGWTQLDSKSSRFRAPSAEL